MNVHLVINSHIQSGKHGCGCDVNLNLSLSYTSKDRDSHARITGVLVRWKEGEHASIKGNLTIFS